MTRQEVQVYQCVTDNSGDITIYYSLSTGIGSLVETYDDGAVTECLPIETFVGSRIHEEALEQDKYRLEEEY